MTLNDLIPSKEQLAGLEGIERRLEERRYKSQWRAILAIASAVIQVAILVWPKNYDLAAKWSALASHGVWETLIHPANWQAREVLPLLPFFAMLVFGAWWVVLRYTGFLFRQSRETFRYTFSVGDLKAIDGIARDGDGAKREDPLKLLQADLSERLNKRVGRLSLLKPGEGASGPSAGEEGAAGDRGSKAPRSHFHVEADYAFRRDTDGEWGIQVWPRVRIGGGNNAFALSFPVRLPLEAADGDRGVEQPPSSRCFLEPAEYERLVERVYSSVATEIYKQIQIDLREKMKLFPTGSLRAAARYYEAKDFEISTTIDSYDRALEMYRNSIDAFKASWLHWLRKRAGFWIPPVMWWDALGVRPALRLEANTRLGYARCLIYRRLASDLAGRSSGAIFPVREELQQLRELLEWCYRAAMPLFAPMPRGLRAPVFPSFGFGRWVRRVAGRGRRRKQKTRSRYNAHSHRLAWLAFPEISQWHPQRKPYYEKLREELCEAYAVSALAYSLLLDSRRAKAYLSRAESLGEGADARRALRLLVKAELEPGLPQKLVYLNEARDLDPESEVILYRLASVSDFVARDQGLINKERVEILVRQNYEAVLKVNPGNIASLIGQGYLLWLAQDLDKAASKFKAGIEVQQVVRQTFVGDLRYGLARVRTEQAAKLFGCYAVREEEVDRARRMLNQAAADYDDAMLADPRVASGSGATRGSGGKTMNSYYEFITEPIRRRYQDFADGVAQMCESSGAAAGNTQSAGGPHHRGSASQTVLGYALNDYGNANLSYFQRFELGTGEDQSLKAALRCFERALDAVPDNTRIQYNQFVATAWEAGPKASETAFGLAQQFFSKDLRLLPREVTSVLSFALEYSSLAGRPRKVAGSTLGRAREPLEAEEAGRLPVVPTPAASARIALRELGIIQGGAPPASVPSLPAPIESTLSGSAAAVGAPLPLRPALHREGRGSGTESEAHPPDGTVMTLPSEDRPLVATATLLMQASPIGKSTRLAPFTSQLNPSRIGELLNNRRIDWSRFGDEEVLALVALLQWWASTASRSDSSTPRGSGAQAERAEIRACRAVAELILGEYYPEHYETLTALLQVDQAEADDLAQRAETLRKKSKPAGKEQDEAATRASDARHIKEARIAVEKSNAIHYAATRSALDEAIEYDPASRLYRKLRLNLCAQRARFLATNESRANRRKLLLVYEDAREACTGLAEYHEQVSNDRERLADRLAAGGASSDRLRQLNRKRARKQTYRALGEIREALRQDPRNEEYRASLVRVHSRWWLAWRGLESSVEKAQPPDLVQVEISQSVVEDLQLKEGLPKQFQAAITAVRKRLESELGLVLPGIRFRDDASFAAGQYRIVIRGVPRAMRTLGSALTQQEKWDAVAAAIERVARTVAPELYDLGDAYRSLGKLEKTGNEDAAALREDDEAMAAFTRVLQSLLAEGVPIVDLAEIASEFCRCRRRGLGMTATIEEVRAIARVTQRLPGNAETIRSVRVLDAAIEKQILGDVDTRGPEPVLREQRELRREVRKFLAETFANEARPGTLIVSAQARPFVAALVSAVSEGVHVLSEREALMPLLARIG